ncbi:MAG TPA: ferric reductase-like transmembrane domain-containing protein [Candidatus Binatia bacterium]|nr:ferric reductase-like transmembrane domain-containing protein [Candidatus Binatia bacterium]
MVRFLPTAATPPRPRASAVPPPQPRRAVRSPRAWGLRPGDAALIVFGNALLIVLMWVRHGQLPNLVSPAADFTAIGQLAALLGTYSALVQVVLMSRSPWLDSIWGIDRIAGWHRWLGFATVYLICGHVFFTTAGFALADGRSFATQTWVFLTTYPYMLMAYVAIALFILIAVTSIRAARRHVSHETWHLIHFYVYLAIALAFGHEVAVGTDFVHDPVALGYWMALYAAALLCIVAFRIVIPMRLGLRHRLHIQSLVAESPQVTSIYIGGRDLAELPMRAGQFFKFRFLARGRWWQVHPFSLSAAPNGEYLRITVKGVGEFSRSLALLRPGTRVLVEGPYGVFTSVRRHHPRALLIAGGIGITPLRALIEEMPQRKNSIALLYRARTWADVVFKDELDRLVSARGGVIHYIVGRRGREIHPHPFAPRLLASAVPDLRQRDVFVCGPREMVDDVLGSLHALGLPARQVHVERFAFLT